MLQEIQDDIIEQLGTIPGAATVGDWEGEIEDLLSQPHRMPSLHVIYRGADFVPFDQAGEHTTAGLEYMVVLMVQNQKSRSAGKITAYAFIEAVREKLIGHQVADYDFLRPVGEKLILSRGGVLAYGLVYQLSDVLIATE